jgi:hypothetical protein
MTTVFIILIIDRREINLRFEILTTVVMFPCPGVYRCVVRMRTDVSEERVTSIFRVEKSAEQETSVQEVIRSSETSVHILTTRRYIPENVNIQLSYSCI